MAAQDEAKPVPILLNALQVGPPLPQGGFCLFTAGAVGSGKSTLQHALIHRLFTDERIAFSFRNEEGETHQDPELLEWIKRFQNGEFPKRTQGRLHACLPF